MQEHRHSGARAFPSEPGIQEHGPEKSISWPVFLDSGPGPFGPSRNDPGVFSHPALMFAFKVPGAIIRRAAAEGQFVGCAPPETEPEDAG